MLTPPPIEPRQSAQIDYRLRVHGIPFRWRSRITHWDPPRRFEATQVSGGYRLWVHAHAFEEQAAGTLVAPAPRPGLDVIHDLRGIEAWSRRTLGR